MFGAIIGDIVGSRFEFNNTKRKDFAFFADGCSFTDDTAMTIAIAEAILYSKNFSALGKNAVACMRKIGREYPNLSYGGMFSQWLYAENPQPYNSFGNGSAMRISPVGFCARTEEEVRKLTAAVTSVTHNHPEGIKGAQAVAAAIFMARIGSEKDEFRKYIEAKYL